MVIEPIYTAFLFLNTMWKYYKHYSQNFILIEALYKPIDFSDRVQVNIYNYCREDREKSSFSAKGKDLPFFSVC